MVCTRINLKKSEIKKIISDIKDTSNIIFMRRMNEPEKDPYSFFLELGIDYKDALNIIKCLTHNDYQYSLFDMNNKFNYLHIFYKEISDKIAYIKLGFKKDKTVVISFHEKIYEN